MKTSNVLASVLFSTMALAAPVDKRAYATKTEIHMEYYTVFTTVTGVKPSAAATSDPALFYEAPKPEITTQQQPTVVTTSSSSSSTSTSVVAPVVPKPIVPAEKPKPTTTSTTPPPAYTAPPAPTTAEAPPAPKPTTAEAPPPSTTAVEAPKPEATEASSGGGGDGEVHKGGSYTMNYYKGGLGACGDPVDDGSLSVALAVDVFGDATVDYMTGKTNNPWCGKKIEITNGGKTAIAYVKDRCSGCTNGGLDATPALWEATTGGLGGSSGDRIYSMSWKVVS